MRHALTEERKEALLDNADKLHSGGSLVPVQLKSDPFDVLWLVASSFFIVLFIGWVVLYA